MIGRRQLLALARGVLAGFLVGTTGRAAADGEADALAELELRTREYQDTLARLLAHHMSTTLGRSVVVENIAGGNGIPASQAVVRSVPDGYTVMITSNTTHAGNQAFLKKLPYDAVADFEPITKLGTITLALVAHPSVPANNLKDFFLSHVNLPLHYVGGNIDLTDYSHILPSVAGHDHDPFVLMKTYINETELNNYPYAMMRSGILFLAIPEMDAEPWTRPATCEWLEFMTSHYHDATTIILSHQAIEDTTPADGAQDSYRGQQDQAWWASLFQRNPQIKMFLHGHNHMAAWYHGSQSSGFSRCHMATLQAPMMPNWRSA